LNGSGVSGQYINENKKMVLNIVDKDTKLCIGHKVFEELLDDKEFFCRGQIFSFDALTTQVKILQQRFMKTKKMNIQ